MKTRILPYLVVTMMLAAAAAALPSCTLQPPTDPGGDVNVSQNVNVNVGNPTPGGSPSPGTGAIDHVSIFSVGDQETGGSSCVSTDPHILHVGCIRRYTCTPKNADGTDVPASVHGPRPDSFTSTTPTVARVEEIDSLPFDFHVRGLGAGITTLSCVVKAIPSRAYEIKVP